MSRPTTIDDETILTAARSVFLARGILATTAEVAERAGVSQGTIFKRFKSKEALFWAAIAPHETRPWEEKLASLPGKGDVRTNIEELAAEIMSEVEVIIPLIMMLWSNSGSVRRPECATTDIPEPARKLRNLSNYFEAEMALGRVRRQDPEIIARTVMGVVFAYVFMNVGVQMNNYVPLPKDRLLAGLSAMLWNGLAPLGLGVEVDDGGTVTPESTPNG